MSRSRKPVGGALAALLLVAAPALADKPGESATSSEGNKTPQVRTYTSVTVLSDPSQAPRLPSRAAKPAVPASTPAAASAPAAATPADNRPHPLVDRPLREERADGVRDHGRLDSVRELRQEIQEMRRDLRNGEKPGPDALSGLPPAQRLEAEKARARQIEQAERRLDRERTHEREHAPERH